MERSIKHYPGNDLWFFRESMESLGLGILKTQLLSILSNLI